MENMILFGKYNIYFHLRDSVEVCKYNRDHETLSDIRDVFSKWAKRTPNNELKLIKAFFYLDRDIKNKDFYKSDKSFTNLTSIVNSSFDGDLIDFLYLVYI